MPAHGLSGLSREVGADRVKYRLVLFFDLAQIFARAIRVTFKERMLCRGIIKRRELEKFTKRLFCVAKRLPDGKRSPSLIARSPLEMARLKRVAPP